MSLYLKYKTEEGYNTEAFDRDYERIGGSYNDNVGFSLLEGEKDIDNHDDAFLRHLGFRWIRTDLHLKYKSGRRYKTKEFDRDFKRIGGSYRDEVALSLLEGKKKLNGEDKRFLLHIGYWTSIDPDWAPTQNEHSYRRDPSWPHNPAWEWQVGDPAGGKGKYSILYFWKLSFSLQEYFNNDQDTVYWKLFQTPIPHYPNPLEFKTIEAENEFIRDLKEIIFISRHSYPSFCKHLKEVTNISKSYSYLLLYFKDIA